MTEPERVPEVDVDSAGLHTALDPSTGPFSGVLERVGFRVHGDCGDAEGSVHEWLVIRQGERPVPIRIGAPATLTLVRKAVDEGGPMPKESVADDAPLLDEGVARANGLKAGDRVEIEGVGVPVTYSGGVALQPVQGIFAGSIRKLP